MPSNIQARLYELARCIFYALVAYLAVSRAVEIYRHPALFPDWPTIAFMLAAAILWVLVPKPVHQREHAGGGPGPRRESNQPTA